MKPVYDRMIEADRAKKKLLSDSLTSKGGPAETGKPWLENYRRPRG